MMDIPRDNGLEEESPLALLVGLDLGKDSDFDNSMRELGDLAEACGMQVTGALVQSLDHPNPATYIGSGKVQEICRWVEEEEIAYVIFEDTLSPAQLKNLQKAIDARVFDRTALILEIFSRRAKTRESRLQVESAQLQYMMPRLIGLWEAQGRQGGGSGSMSNKGIGETQLELDRRLIQRRISELRRELDAIEHDREVQRQRREKGSLPLVALVGYTNAGKSTVMNRLIGMSDVAPEKEKEVLEKDMLFATLDTSVRKISVADHMDFLLSDTVGFIDKLPHQLVKAFRSTLDEVRFADLLVEVVDVSDEHYREQMEVTASTLRELGAEKIPAIHVLNKADRCMEPGTYPRREGDRIILSAANEEGLDELLAMIEEMIYAGNRTEVFLIPYANGGGVDELCRRAKVLEREYLPEGVRILADCTPELLGKYEDFLVNKSEKKEEE